MQLYPEKSQPGHELRAHTATFSSVRFTKAQIFNKTTSN